MGRALIKAQQANSQLVPYQGISSYSPLVQQYEDWTTAYGQGLPYDVSVFRNGAFAPMDPIRPNYIDQPDIIDGQTRRPPPRIFQYPVGWNLPIGDPGTEGIKLANFQILRSIAEASSITRACIQVCKADILNLEWDIQPTKEKHLDMVNNLSSRKEFENRRRQVKEFFLNPDPQQNEGFNAWLESLLEDLIVLDAVALYVLPTKRSGSGVLGSSVAGLQLIDGTTIRPLLDIRGCKPLAPAPAYQQYLWGVPRTDLMRMIDLGPDATLEDIEQINPDLISYIDSVNEYSGDQMVYYRQTERSFTPYGFGPTEQSILPNYLALARQTWQYDFFDNSSLPRVFMDPGPTVTTANQIRQLMRAINQVGGNLEQAWQVFVTPPGAKVAPQKEPNLTDQFDEWLVATVCMGYQLSISDLGITPKVGGMTSPAMAKQDANKSSQNVNRRAVLPRIMALKKRLFDKIIKNVLKQSDMEFAWSIETRQVSEDEINSRINLLSKGGITLDEMRIKNNEQPYNLPETSVPMVLTPTGFIPFGQPPVQPEPVNQPANTPNTSKTPPKTPKQTAEMIGKFLKDAEIFTRFVKSGKDITNFKASFPRGFLQIGKLYESNLDKGLKNAISSYSRRETSLQPLRTQLNSQVQNNAQLLKENLITLQKFEKAMAKLIKELTQKAANFGTSDASDDWNVPKVDTDSITKQYSHEILGFVMLFAAAIISKNVSDKQLINRSQNYGDSLTRVYEAGYGKSLPSNSKALWITEDDPCDLCDSRDGKVYTLSDLPGWPGDGDFGEICEGGPLCKCHLSWKAGKLTDNQMRVQQQANQNSGGNIVPDNWSQTGELNYPVRKALSHITHAGIAVRAKDTGRVYLQQRRTDHPKKPGIWEFPVGGLDEGEDLFLGAKREWEEEVELPLPKGELIDSWIDGSFIGFVWEVEHQDCIPSTHRPTNEEVSGHVMWIQPSEALNLLNLRDELKQFFWGRL